MPGWSSLSELLLVSPASSQSGKACANAHTYMLVPVLVCTHHITSIAAVAMAIWSIP
ncbi:hypothetical protein V8C40DRAFT_238370 [Trichoderma camerunense]